MRFISRLFNKTTDSGYLVLDPELRGSTKADIRIVSHDLQIGIRSSEGPSLEGLRLMSFSELPNNAVFYGHATKSVQNGLIATFTLP